MMCDVLAATHLVVHAADSIALTPTLWWQTTAVRDLKQKTQTWLPETQPLVLIHQEVVRASMHLLYLQEGGLQGYMQLSLFLYERKAKEQTTWILEALCKQGSSRLCWRWFHQVFLPLCTIMFPTCELKIGRARLNSSHT